MSGFSRLLGYGALVLLLPAIAAAQPWKWPWEAHGQGETIVIAGRVVDPEGRAIGGVSVLLEASRTAFKWKKMRRETGNALETPSVADAEGRFRFDWKWDRYYETFTLLVALPVRNREGETFEVFARREVSDAVRQGRAADLELVVERATDLAARRAFLDSITSDDEKRVYREMGLPDRVDTGIEDYDPDRSWWYFAAGRVYRFRGGMLEQVVPFEPVPLEPVDGEPVDGEPVDGEPVDGEP